MAIKCILGCDRAGVAIKCILGFALPIYDFPTMADWGRMFNQVVMELAVGDEVRSFHMLIQRVIIGWKSGCTFSSFYATWKLWPVHKYHLHSHRRRLKGQMLSYQL